MTRWRGAEAGAASFCLRAITRVAAGAAKKLAQPACSRRHAYRMYERRVSSATASEGVLYSYHVRGKLVNSQKADVSKGKLVNSKTRLGPR